jgi:hypothetical protein
MACSHLHPASARLKERLGALIDAARCSSVPVWLRNSAI